MADELLPPLEIPWTLAATTQPLAPFEPADNAISLFYFEPDDEALTSEFPDDRLVYLKFTVTISPADFPPNLPLPAGMVLGEGVPCFHMLLDLKVRKAGGDPGSIRPYFHAAAPMNRRMIQSGVVGVEEYEGEADAQFTGKSGSQMYETSSGRTRTTSMGASAGGGIGPINVGASVRRTATDVSAQRSISQTVDTTSRQASEERRELISHHTNVENILTLLNAKYVGTPHLSFSLSPQPLYLLSLDPSDPNLWFSQLLQRRSSGIEGIQEFTTVVLVPRDQDFCVNARLRRVCVLNNPPGPLTFEPFNIKTPQHVGRLLNYLDRAYPPGTPLEELDVDLMGALTPQDQFIRPVIQAWWLAAFVIIADIVSPTPAPGFTRTQMVNYKHNLETWLDAQRDEYERDVIRSPLERGVILQEHRFLDTCFSFAAAGGLVVTSSSLSATPLHRLAIPPTSFDLGGVSADARSVRADVRERAYEAITRWNLLENRLATLLANRRDVRAERFRLDDPDIVNILIDVWAKLPPSDSRNLAFDAAVDKLHLTRQHRRLLKAAGATDLRTIAAAIRNAAPIARYKDRLAELHAADREERIDAVDAEIVRGSLSVNDAENMRRTIGTGLQAEMPDERGDG